MSLTLLFGALTLAPAIAAILVLALGLARRPLLLAVVALATIGVLVPIAALLELTPDVSFTIPLRVSLLGAPVDAAFAPLLRADALGLYAAFGVSVLVIPLLIWIALRASPTAVLVTSSSDEETGEPESQEPGGLLQRMLSGGQWASIALILGLESALLFLCFTDNIAWMALCWVVAVLLVWALGEVGSEPDTLDYPGLGFLVLGPALWLVAMVFVASAGGAPALLDLTGGGAVTFLAAVLIALGLAAAGGGYPFFVWLRRRAAFASPAGVAATVIGAIPAAIFVGGRTYGALSSKDGLWPIIGVANPPITAGIAFVLLGALSVAISGLLALGRRDARTLVALVAAAQTGWGLLAIGIEQPASTGALVLLLATTVLGMGALLGSAIVGGTVSVGEEPEGAGPRPFDQPLRMPALVVWGIGAVTLLGVPLFAGFSARELISAGALEGTKLAIPLVGLAWIGEALLAIALLRATAPAFTYTLADDEDEFAGGDEAAEKAAVAEGAVAAESEPVEGSADGEGDSESESDLEGETDEESAEEVERPVGASRWRESLPLLPAALFAALALILGIAPQALFGLGANLAAGDLLQADAFPHNVTVKPTGITTPTGQWIPSIAWVIVLILVVLFALLRMPRPRVVADFETTEPEDTGVEVDGALVEEMDESASLAAPTEAWEQLQPAFTSEFLQPGASFLLDGTDDEVDEELDEEIETEAEAEEVVEDAQDTEAASEREQPLPGDDVPTEPDQNGAGTATRPKPAKRSKDNGA